MRPIQRLLALSIAASLLFLFGQACAQSASTTSKIAPSDVQTYIDKQVLPYWLDQKGLLSKTIASPPTQLYKSLWDELDASEKSKTPRDALALAMQAKSPDERNARMIWLRWRIANGNADSRYSYAYAYLLSTTAESGSTKPMMSQSAAFFLQARIALAIDGARCADQASSLIARRSLEQAPYMAPILNHIATAPKPEIADALTNATTIEQMRPARPHQDWLCNLGAATMKKALDNQADVKKNGNNVVIDTTGIAPDYISDGVWLQRKQAILDEQINAIVSYFH